MQLRVGLLQMADCGPSKEDLLAKGEALLGTLPLLKRAIFMAGG